jgi:hypothetical protein
MMAMRTALLLATAVNAHANTGALSEERLAVRSWRVFALRVF